MILLIFLIGWVANSFISPMISTSLESPLTLPFGVSSEKASPGNHVPESNIKVYSDKVLIAEEGILFAKYANTNSMDPLFDESANGLEKIPASPEDVHVGDIVSYNSGLIDSLIVHRVISINEDSNGTYYTLKGDNNFLQDPERVRFEQIHGVLIGIIY